MVLEVQTAKGSPLIVKSHNDVLRNQLEVAAYRRWVPAIDAGWAEQRLRANSARGHLVQIAWATEHVYLQFAEEGRANLATMRRESSI